jgi:Zn finger protein HypA/HybF involved in hydrogenase expression
MKQVYAARELGDGVIEPKHEVEILCVNCQDPVSEEEQATNTCTNCGSPWQAQQSVNIHVTSLPIAQAMSIKIG